MIYQAKLISNKANYAVDRTGTEINTVQKQIATKKKAKQDAEDLLLRKSQLQEEKQTKEEGAASKLDALLRKVRLVGNYVHDTVPVSTDEVDNQVVRKWAPEGFDLSRKLPLPHHEVLRRLGGYDPERGVKLVGHRGYCLTGHGMFLCVSVRQFKTLSYLVYPKLETWLWLIMGCNFFIGKGRRITMLHLESS